jgi:DNA-binding NarL/FixJ family response regulator
MQVMIVDDSRLVRERLVELLDGIADVEIVGQATTVAEGIAALTTLHPDFVLLDLQMPDGDGTAVLDAAKHLAHPPIVAMLTNYPLPQFRKRCLKAGADFFWDKSRDFARIPATLRRLAHA